MTRIDFFIVPTLRNQLLFEFLALALEQRRVVYFNVAAHPTGERTGQQMG